MDGAPPEGLGFPDVAKLELDQLIDELVERARGVQRTQGRLRSLLRAIDTVNGQLDLPAVLRHVVEAGCELAGARYGALGVIGREGGLQQFVHVGIDGPTVASIGDLPQGKGLLGALISDPRPITIDHLSGDPRSTGFPPGHPPMDSFLGVPILVRGEVFGNLYLTDSERGTFTGEDEQLVSALALAAGTALTNARLYDESRRQQRWLEASLAIGRLLLTSAGDDPLQLIAEYAHEVADADLVMVALLTDDQQQIVIENAVGTYDADLVGSRFTVAGTISAGVVRDGAPLLLDQNDLDTGEHSPLLDIIDAGALMVLPLQGELTTRGVLAVARRRGRTPFLGQDLSMAAGFASHASLALELADSRAAERRLALLEDRDRIARDLHDHVIQELFAVGLGMEGVAAQLAGVQDGRLAARVLQSVDDVDRTIRRIRTSIFDLHGSFIGAGADGLRRHVLDLVAELTPVLGFAPHVGFTGAVDSLVDEALGDDVTACVREALTNIAKHARASTASVDISVDRDELLVTVTDDGVGVGTTTRASGLANLAARATARGGHCDVLSSPAGGTTISWKVLL